MARRRKKDTWASVIAPLLGLFFLLWFFSPGFRQTIVGVGYALLILCVLAIVVGIGVAIYRSGREPTSSATDYRTNVFAAVPQAVPDLASNSASEGQAPQVNHAPLPAVWLMPSPEKPASTAELIERLRSIDWFQFEKVVALTYRKLGYSVSRRGGANPDGGIDLVIRKDETTSAVQCKHWRNRDVGVRHLREFLGALTDAKIQKGIFVTLCGYSGESKQLAEKHGIEILNETGLARMLELTDIMSTTEAARILSDRQKVCPKCEREMVLRTASKGPGAGKQFWGCSGYPKCRFTMQLSSGQPRKELAGVRHRRGF
jgi:ssDNA-binding Zn-finger/Zn-ribbon topoisomerase 1/Na+-transporting methylmalonyl-CoA/oxaloacetate decarboxylase gamma subunit